MKKIVLTGGGTGGHVIPHLSLIDNLKKDYTIHYIGTNGIEKDIIAKYPEIQFHTIDAVKFDRKKLLKIFSIPLKLLKCIKQAKQILKEIKPDVIFSKGGYVSIPVVFAGYKLNIPIISHESDLSMGLANKLIYRKCNVMCTTFKETAKKKKMIYTGPPIREKLFKGNKEKGYQMTKLNNSKKVLLFIGGSTGAKTINEFVYNNIKELTKEYNIIHICGKGKKQEYTLPNYYQTEFTNNIEDILAITDIVISRAGSNAIFEFLALKKPMILIPLPKGSSRGDQIENAKLFQRNKYASVILQENLTYSNLINEINVINKNYKNIVSNMENSHISNSNEKICNIIRKYSK